MKFELFTRVALREDFSRHQLHQGDLAVVVDCHPVIDGEDGYSIEIFNTLGKTIAVLIISESQIEALY